MYISRHRGQVISTFQIQQMEKTKAVGVDDVPRGVFPWRTIVIVVLVALLILSFVRPVVQQDVDDNGLDDSNESSTKKPPTTKLQIGIKKRIENCQRKSKKGDLLHIHYRVRFLGDCFFCDYNTNMNILM